MKKYTIMLLPQLILATTVGTDIKMEGLRPILEINVKPHENVSLKTKASYDMVEQNVEGNYKVNDYVEVSAEAFVGYENIKEDNSKLEKQKFEDDKKVLENLKSEIENEDDLDKIIDSIRKLENRHKIKESIKDEVSRKDVYKKLKEKIESYGTKFGNTSELLKKAIESKTTSEEQTNIVNVMINIKNNAANGMENYLIEGARSLQNAFDNEKVNNQKVKEAFEKFYMFFSKSEDFKSISEDFSSVSKLYDKADEKKATIKHTVFEKIEDLNGRIKQINSGKGSNLKLIRHHIYYGLGVGSKFSYMNFEGLLKGRIGASTYLTKIDDNVNIENKVYASLDSSVRYNWRINKFNIIPELGVKYTWSEYGQKGFIPYGSFGFNYIF